MNPKEASTKVYLDYPPGLERNLLRIFEKRVGRDNLITKKYLRSIIDAMPGCHNLDERKVRAAINVLRKQGHLICSTAQDGGGYWIADNPGDIDEFIRREIDSRIVDLSETKKALKESAKVLWGEGIQLGLF